MTDEQLAIIRSFLEDFEKLADIASEMSWAKTDTKHIELRIPYSSFITDPSIDITTIRFEKGFVSEHFAESVSQVMIAATTLNEGCDADKEWQDDELRRDMLKNYWGIAVWDSLEYKEISLTEESIDEMTRYICENTAYDSQLKKQRDYELPPDAQAMLSFFHDVKLYNIGEEPHIGYGGGNWIALKDDTFLWVRYSGITD